MIPLAAADAFPRGDLPAGAAAPLPEPAGELSAAIFALLRSDPDEADSFEQLPGRIAAAAAERDPLADDDLHLALYACFELGYRGFPGVADEWEWEPVQLAARAALERTFLKGLAEAVPRREVRPDEVAERLFALEKEDHGPPLSRYLETRGSDAEFAEFVVHRSAYQLKEADPHSWAIPRLFGPAKSALVEIQADEYGGGRAERMHSVLFATTMRSLGLDPRPNAYLGSLPGRTLATVNLMSSFGLRRSSRGALVGHLAIFEMTSARPNRAYGNGLRRLGGEPAATDFFDEHVAADAVHENIAAYDLAGGLARLEPGLAGDIIFGAEALLDLEGRFAAHLLGAWRARRDSLRRPLARGAVGRLDG